MVTNPSVLPEHPQAGRTLLDGLDSVSHWSISKGEAALTWHGREALQEGEKRPQASLGFRVYGS